MKLWGIDKYPVKLESTEVKKETNKSYSHESVPWLGYRCRTAKDHKNIHLTAKDAIDSFYQNQLLVISRLQDRLKTENNILEKIKEWQSE